MHGRGDLDADPCWRILCPQLESAAVNTFDFLLTRLRSAAVACQQALKLLRRGVADGVLVQWREAVQDKFLDVQLDGTRIETAHAHPPISAAVNGRSSLAYSTRAARSRWVMPTGAPASAARNAA